MDNKEFLQQWEADFETLDDFDDLDVMKDSDSHQADSKVLHGDIMEISADDVLSDDLEDDSAFSFGDESYYTDSAYMDDPEGSDSDSLSEQSSTSALAGLTVDFSFDVGDLDESYSLAESGQAGPDEKLLRQQLKNTCSELGYAVANGTSLETMKMIQEYALACQQEIDFHSVYTRYYSQMLMQLAASSSLHVSQHASMTQYKAKLLKCVQDPLLQDACAMAVNMIYDQISRFRRENSDVINIRIENLDLNGVYRGLLGHPRLVTTYIATQESKLKNFISTAAGILIENEISDESAIRNDTSRRDSLSRALTAEAYQTTAAMSGENHAYIRDISSSNGGNMVCTCAKCGKQTKIKALMRFVFFSSGKDLVKYVYPIINKCECGSLLFFPMHLYAKAITHYEGEYGTSLNSAIEKAKNFSGGTAVLSVTPAISQLPPEIQCIITDSETIRTEHTERVIEVFHPEEWDRAVEQFYRHLELLQGYTIAKNPVLQTSLKTVKIEDNRTETKTDDNYSTVAYDFPSPNLPVKDSCFLSLIAANVAQIAGTDYNTLKGKALVSLITYLNNNILLRQNLEFDHVASANAVLRLIEGYRDNPKADINRLEPAVFNYLMEIAGYINPEFEIIRDKNEVKAFLSQHATELQMRYEKIAEKYCEFMEDLAASKFALGCLPITDYQQTPVYSIVQLIIDEPVFHVVNEICDRMIISNYATNYFNYWCRLSMKHVNTLKQRLLTSADLGKIKASIDSVKENLLLTYGINMSNIYTPNAIVQSLDTWETLKKLSDIAESGNYYKFCSLALSLEQSDYGFGKEFNEILEDFRFVNYEEMSKVTQKSEVEYYLGDMFTREELEAGKDHFENLIFGRYLPIRTNAETIEEYVTRFREADISKCVDNSKRFQRIRHLSCIYFGSAIMECKYSNFRVASFMSGLLVSVTQTATKQALACVGISDLRYSVLIKNTRLWKFSDFDIHNKDIVTLFNSFYFTEIHAALIDSYTDMTSQYFVASDTITPLSEIFDFGINLDDNIRKVSQLDDLPDIISMIEELRDWEYTEGYVSHILGDGL